MWLILQQPEPDDYVLATGETHTVRSFVEAAFAAVGREIVWEGEGVNEVGRGTKNNDVLVQVDPRYFRPTEVDLLIGDATKAREKLGWRHRISLQELVSEMIASDIHCVAQERQRRNRDG
jgi:GDPmannose 4,6-dehydratase